MKMLYQRLELSTKGVCTLTFFVIMKLVLSTSLHIVLTPILLQLFTKEIICFLL